jgi:hypothetical protein
MSATVKPVETNFLSGTTGALALAANPSRAYLQLQNKDTGLITYKFGANFLANASAVQKIMFSAPPTAGTWTVTFGASTSAAMQFNANAATVTAALEAMASIGAGGIVVTGDYTAGLTCTFAGEKANMPQALLTVTTTLLTNSAVQSNAIQSIAFSEPPTAGTFKVSFGADTTAALNFDISATDLMTALNALTAVNNGISALTQDGTTKDFSVTMGGASLRYAAQALLVISESTLTGEADLATAIYVLQSAVAPVKGTFKLSDGTGVTAALNYDCTAAQVQAALEALATIGAGNVVVAGIDLVNGFTIAYGGTLANTEVAELIVYPLALDGMDLNTLQGDTLDTDDVDAGLDESGAGGVGLTIAVDTAGHGVNDITTTVATTVAGGAPGPVTAVVTTITTGVLVTNDGVDISTKAGQLWDAEVPTEALYIKSANSSAAVTILEG